jgi:hypothetical protein
MSDIANREEQAKIVAVAKRLGEIVQPLLDGYGLGPTDEEYWVNRGILTGAVALISLEEAGAEGQGILGLAQAIGRYAGQMGAEDARAFFSLWHQNVFEALEDTRSDFAPKGSA